MANYSYCTADGSLYGRLKEFAKSNRKNPTDAERALWNMIKCCRLGQDFKRQQVIGCFIADFVCLTSNLIVELDGSYHNLPEQQVSDEERTRWLENQGFKVIRFANEEVIGNTDNVLQKIKENLK